MKGQATYPFSIIETLFTFLLIIGIASGVQVTVNDFVIAKTAGVNAENIKNTALALDTIPKGHIEIQMSEYKIKLDGRTVRLRFKKAIANSTINKTLTSYEDIDGPTNYTRLNGTICLRKNKESNQINLEIKPGDC